MADRTGRAPRSSEDVAAVLPKEAQRCAGAATKVPSLEEQVSAVIAPGGVFAEADDLSKGRRRCRRPKVSTYNEAYPGLIPDDSVGGFAALQAEVVYGLRSRRPKVSTAERIVAHEPLQSWRQHLTTSKVLDSASEEVLAEASRAQQQRSGLSREEHEKRWRRWMKHKQREAEGGAPSTVSGTEQTVASSIPAGLRPAKCIGDDFPDGIRCPLFGEDLPQPIWTTLATAPWLQRKRQPLSQPQAEAPYPVINDPHHPLLQKRTLATVSARGARSDREDRSVARSGALSAREQREGAEVAAAGFPIEGRDSRVRGVAKRPSNAGSASQSAQDSLLAKPVGLPALLTPRGTAAAKAAPPFALFPEG
eukprot:TRINITY_DN52020_c0_g1_i1.p1 TRINITY_DN52020_c0_g1~~TRINITY_DN52020_c0_g1_i1.p1  ORF type:complete len:373 (-),score=82.28 TRINITY_DN52020_c0_g1_i1:86-1177(-)